MTLCLRGKMALHLSGVMTTLFSMKMCHSSSKRGHSHDHHFAYLLDQKTSATPGQNFLIALITITMLHDHNLLKFYTCIFTLLFTKYSLTWVSKGFNCAQRPSPPKILVIVGNKKIRPYRTRSVHSRCNLILEQWVDAKPIRSAYSTCKLGLVGFPFRAHLFAL